MYLEVMIMMVLSNLFLTFEDFEDRKVCTSDCGFRWITDQYSVTSSANPGQT